MEEEGEGGGVTEEDSQAMLQEFIDYIKVGGRGRGRGREYQFHEVIACRPMPAYGGVWSSRN